MHLSIIINQSYWLALGTSSRTSSSRPACTRTRLYSPFVPLAWVATCAPVFAIATQALYIALFLSRALSLSLQLALFKALALFHNLFLIFNIVVCSSWSLVSLSIINVLPNNLFPLSVVMSGEDVVSRPSSDSTLVTRSRHS